MLLTAKAMKQLSDNNAYKLEKDYIIKEIIQDANDQMVVRARSGFTYLIYDVLRKFDLELFREKIEVAKNIPGFTTNFGIMQDIIDGLKQIGYEASLDSSGINPEHPIPLIRITWKNA